MWWKTQSWSLSDRFAIDKLEPLQTNKGNTQLLLGEKTLEKGCKLLYPQADFIVIPVCFFSEANFNTFLEFVIDKQGDSRDSVDELEKSFKLFDLGE